MFTEGRVYFTLIFILVFVLALVFAYRKDAGVHKKFFDGTILILLVVIVFVVLFVLAKRMLLGV
ncbi:MAG: hypothetical protein MH137_06285 [Flavobacteriales bacterium]|nr:hypothetical protein [Flavobacteriales bacterium]